MLGLTQPSVRSLKCVACMFYAYHVLKLKHAHCLRNISSDPESGSHIQFTHQVADAAASRRIFAGAFRAVALNLGIVCRDAREDV